ncbi:MAG: hypothetical protein P8Y45_04145 [Exilibacterium sp.]
MLSHEQAHQSRKDNLRLLLAHIFTQFFPASLANLIRKDLIMWIEQECDRLAAIEHDNLDVAQTLLHVHKLINAYGSNTLFENRINTLLNSEFQTNPLTVLLCQYIALLAQGKGRARNNFRPLYQ